MKEINGKTRVCGLIGNPVEHTLSPLIHNMLAQEAGQNLVYVPFLVENGLLEKAIEGARSLRILGLNITVPYKSEVIPLLDEVDELAQKIGAVNTLVSTEDGFKGYNTDMLGLFRAMQSDGINLREEEIILLGAGGAARAVAYLCADSGAKRIYLLNRTIGKAQAIAEEVNASFGRTLVIPMPLGDYRKLSGNHYLAIQASSVGLYPNTEDAILLDQSFYEKIKVGYDLIYRPAQTKFMRMAKECKKSAYNGLKMLLYQGIIAYELWNNVTIPEETAEKIYQQMRKELGSNE